jgi:multimeric flavodoxin WrbA
VKVLGISCSLRKGGNTEILVEEALAGANEAQAEVELLTLIGKEIKPCDGCGACRKTGECHINDDMQPIYGKLLEADGIIFGSPVYFWQMAGQAKVLLDRTYAFRYPRFRLANKVGGVIVVGGRIGLMNAIGAFYTYFACNHMFTVDYAGGLAGDKGTVRKDKFAMRQAREVGKQVALLSGKGMKFPEEYDCSLHSYIEAKYGLKSAPFE